MSRFCSLNQLERPGVMPPAVAITLDLHAWKNIFFISRLPTLSDSVFIFADDSVWFPATFAIFVPNQVLRCTMHEANKAGNFTGDVTTESGRTAREMGVGIEAVCRREQKRRWILRYFVAVLGTWSLANVTLPLSEFGSVFQRTGVAADITHQHDYDILRVMWFLDVDAIVIILKVY